MRTPLWLAAGLAVTVAVASTVAAAQQPTAAAYPAKPVRLVIPFAPGAPPTRWRGSPPTKLAKRLGAPFVAENVTGAGGTIGAGQVAKAAGDGYTLLAGSRDRSPSARSPRRDCPTTSPSCARSR